MVRSATGSVRFAGRPPLPLDVDFLGGRLTSDGGLPWLAEADAALGEVYLRERERGGGPRHVVLDLDGTDDPTHGRQEETAWWT